jgi:hypothetical protein
MRKAECGRKGEFKDSIEKGEEYGYKSPKR